MMKKLREITRDNTFSAESSRKLQLFLGLLECEKIPEWLFERAVRTRHSWSRTGDLTTVGSLVPKWLRLLLEDEYGQNRTQTGQSTLRAGLRDRQRVANNKLKLEEISPEEIERTLFDILSTVMQSFPEPYGEILWQESTVQLWPVVHSACLPFLAVIDLSDIRRYILSRSSADKLKYPTFLVAFTRFLHQVIVALRFKGPPNLLHLSTQAISFLLDDITTKADKSLLHDVLCLKETEGILRNASLMEIDYSWMQGHFSSHAYREETTIPYKVILAELQLALWNTFPELLGRLYSENAPSFMEDCRKTTIWSSMEALVKTNAIGAQFVKDAIGIAWRRQPVTVRVLVAFRAIYDKEFATAMEMLETDFEEVMKTYGTSSAEFVVVGTQLALCYNALRMEINTGLLVGEMIRAIWPKQKSGYISSKDIACPRSVLDLYLFTAYSDSFIGLGLYERAKSILLDLGSSLITDNEVAVLCVLRILKINRRQQAQDPSFDNWTLLQGAIALLDSISGGALYQCFDEAMCMLSVVDSLDTTEVSRAKDIIDALDTIDINRFDGSDSMRMTLHEYKQELKLYRRDFSLFSVTGPQLHYCRNIRERFPKASIALIERIGTANWERFQRLKETQQTEEVLEPIVTVEPSKFHDSGIGSSLQSSILPAIIQAPRSKAKSKLSISTIPGPGLSELLQVPAEIVAGKLYHCEWCGKKIIFTDPKYQWPHHVYADLRPYICIVEGCNVSTAFGSQTEFEQHLTTHAFMDAMICPICNHASQDMHHFKEHFRLAHPSETLPAAVDPKKVPRDLDAQLCPFCAVIPGSSKFIRHVALHCEEIALSSLSRTFDDDSDDGDASETASTYFTKDTRDTWDEDHFLNLSDDAFRTEMDRRTKQKQDALDAADEALEGFAESKDWISYSQVEYVRPEISQDLELWTSTRHTLEKKRTEGKATNKQTTDGIRSTQDTGHESRFLDTVPSIDLSRWMAFPNSNVEGPIELLTSPTEAVSQGSVMMEPLSNFKNSSIFRRIRARNRAKDVPEPYSRSRTISIGHFWYCDKCDDGPHVNHIPACSSCGHVRCNDCERVDIKRSRPIDESRSVASLKGKSAERSPSPVQQNSSLASQKDRDEDVTAGRTEASDPDIWDGKWTIRRDWTPKPHSREDQEMEQKRLQATRLRWLTEEGLETTGRRGPDAKADSTSDPTPQAHSNPMHSAANEPQSSKMEAQTSFLSPSLEKRGDTDTLYVTDKVKGQQEMDDLVEVYTRTQLEMEALRVADSISATISEKGEISKEREAISKADKAV